MKEVLIMKKAFKYGIVLALALGAAGVAYTQAAQMVPQTSVLSGTVISVVAEGTPVKEGDVLVTVNSLAGPVPAVRASGDGVVKEVRAVRGQAVGKQDVLAVIETK